MKIASVLNIRLGGVFCVFSDGISGDLMAALRLLATDGGECVLCVCVVCVCVVRVVCVLFDG